MRVRLKVAYAGTAYAGWQVQPGKPTVQGSLEEIVDKVAGRKVRVTGASRTDAGVHASGQVCHFDIPATLSPESWQRAFNGLLAADIRVLDASLAEPGFHARYSAHRKVYRYHLDPAPLASPFLAPFSWHRPGLVELDDLAEAASLLEGPLDQRLFASRPEGDRPIRPIEACSIDAGRLVTITIVGRSFLRHAVRGIVGMLVEVGSGRRSPSTVSDLLRGERSASPPVKAPSRGLCLARVQY
ncbi:MAG: tRNA pseudouridine(38-40) synthase TruA [Acidobacteriota bacterium]